MTLPLLLASALAVTAPDGSAVCRVTPPDLGTDARLETTNLPGGVAWRIRYDGTGPRTVAREEWTFDFGKDLRCWPVSHAQGEYVPRTLSAIASLKPNRRGTAECPLVVEGDGWTAALGDAGVTDYARLRFATGDRPGQLKAVLEGPASFTAPFVTPWRYVHVSKDCVALANAQPAFLDALNAPSRIADTSWIKPGKVLRVCSLNEQDGRACVDFAKRNNFQYVELDAGWYGPERTGDPLKPNAYVKPVIDYANANGVGVILYVNDIPLHKNRDAILDQLSAWGVKGVKYGFVQVGGQAARKWVLDAIQAAADRRLLVDIHDEYRLTGIQKTYPNVLTVEGIRGNEEMPTAAHDAALPFTRFLDGPGDYTPCWNFPRIKNTLAHQLALPCVYSSGFQFLFWYQRPSQIKEQDPALDFWREIPCAFDETRFLQGQIGAFAVVARRAGGKWFVGGINAGEKRLFSVPLAFAGPGRLKVRLFRDFDPDNSKPCADIACESFTVDSADALTVAAALNGGVAAIVERDEAPAAPAVVTVDPRAVVGPASPDLWGIFFEDIDLSLDGGVYAELVRNRSFEDGNGEKREQTLRYWLPLGNAEISPNKNHPVSEKNPHSARVRGPAGAGIANEGYFGMGVRKGMTYNLSIALRGAVKGPVEVTLEAYGKPALAHARIDGVDADWRTFSAELEANDSDPQARLAIRMAGGGDMYVDCVSLMPADAVCGIFRRDLMDRLAALKPSFVRFPGGCWVEGDTMKDAYRWKQTLGSVWERRTQWNIWRYWSANGVGFHEYLLLCEALGAKPLFCINCGMSHRENVPMDKMDEFVQDALDCIEYANGPTNSVWGARRAAAGHPEPFGLKYLEIGNENGGKAYEERYALMAKAVRARYPDVTLIFDNWRETKRVDDPKDLRDDHFYKMPHDFMGDLAHEYDAPKGDFGIFVGEYAVTRGTTRYGSLRGAIAEAAFMLGLERNQSQVKLAAYAPLFANAQHIVWNPNMIYPTTDGSFVSPSWNVQKLFSENRGTDVVKVDVKTPSIRLTRFRAWKNDVQTNVIDCVQASAMRTAGGGTVLKLVNCAETPQRVEIRGLTGEAARTLFTGPGRDAHNAPFEPEALKEKTDRVRLPASLTLPPLSLSIYTL